jgi:hypothetical protein
MHDFVFKPNSWAWAARVLCASAFVLAGGLLLGPERLPAADDAAWGTVKGRIVWGGGDVPAPVPVSKELLDKNQDRDHCLSKGPLLSEEWVIHKQNKGIRWTFVWLAPEPGDPKKKLPIHPSLVEIKEKEVSIDQPCCAFIPHALGVRQGQKLVAKNSSPVSHNVNCAGHPLKNPQVNFLIPAGKQLDIDNLQADERFPVKVSCNIHPWMGAWIRVFDHPYYAVSDENGNFEIKLAPAGEYRLKVWHEAVGWRGGADGRDGQKITIKPNAVTDLGQLDLKP